VKTIQCWYTFETPDKNRPAVILTRDCAITVLQPVAVALITPYPDGVVLTQADGLPEDATR
jgi:mRNA-degrading endonuclease toxin of MazEF toxin-antitoxin module